MRLLKLDTTTSTNDFLKEMAARQNVENFTVVTALEQTNGKGQMGAKWVSQRGKNLIVSVLVKDLIVSPDQIFDLNIIFAISVVAALEAFDIPKLSIKWPNDIMSGNKKIGGILIENQFKADGKIISVAGLGLNVNQSDFSMLPKASSLSAVCQREFDVDMVLKSIVEKFESNVGNLSENRQIFWQYYHSKLFKFGVPMPFEDLAGNKFMAIVQGVDNSGKLKLRLEDDSVAHFGIKEIQMLY